MNDDRSRRGILRGMVAAAVGTTLVSTVRGEEARRISGNARDFGAVGDGRADDTAALQRAIDQGGLLHLPGGTYCYSALRAEKPVIVQGDGARTAILKKTTAEGEGILVESPQVHLRDVGFAAGVRQTGGCYLRWIDKVWEVSLSNFTMEGAFVGVRNAAAYRTQIELGSMRNAATGPGSACIVVDGGNDHFVRCVTADNPKAAMPEAGIRIEQTGCINLTDIDIIDCGKDLYLRPTPPGGGVYSIFAANCFFDTATCGLAIECIEKQVVARCVFTNCWFCSHTDRGIAISGKGIIDTLQFVNCQILFNGAGGVDIGAGSNIAIQNSTISNNGPFGVRLACNESRITGNKIGSSPAMKGHDVGILGAGGDWHLIQGNHLRGNSKSTAGDFGANSRIDSNLS